MVTVSFPRLPKSGRYLDTGSSEPYATVLNQDQDGRRGGHHLGQGGQVESGSQGHRLGTGVPGSDGHRPFQRGCGRPFPPAPPHRESGHCRWPGARHRQSWTKAVGAPRESAADRMENDETERTAANKRAKRRVIPMEVRQRLGFRGGFERLGILVFSNFRWASSFQREHFDCRKGL